MIRLFLGIMGIMSLPALAADALLLDHEFRKLASSESVNLNAMYRGKLQLVENTASKCGNTP